MATIVFPDHAFDHRIGLIVGGETLFVERPLPGLGIGVFAAIGKIDLSDPHQVFIFQAVALVILLPKVREGAGPKIRRILEFMARPSCRAEVLRRLLA